MEVGRQPGLTAFQVRKAFRASPSAAWSSSAGAVYTAVERLIDAGLLKKGEPLDRRGTRHLHLTAAGRRASRSWLLDLTSGISLGIDPFRLRAPGWTDLPRADYRDFMSSLLGELEQQRAHLTTFARDQADAHDQIRAHFALDLVRSRLKWVRNQLKSR